jgi:hypothetical protein
MGKFAKMFQGKNQISKPTQRSKSDMPSCIQKIPKKNFNKALGPRQSMEGLIKQPMVRDEPVRAPVREPEPVRRENTYTRERSAPTRQSMGEGSTDPYSQFASPYRSG